MLLYRSYPAAFSALALISPASTWAQDEQAEQASTSAPIPPSAPATHAQTFDPAYFERYSPRNALDMLQQVPGFTVTETNSRGRGLGQASENVLVNGARLSSKSDSATDQLARIPASDVIRIEIVEGTSLDIPGLSGQVANVIVNRKGETSGQFRWSADFRPHNTEAQFYEGEISLTGHRGALEYTVSLQNDNERFGADGPALITDGNGVLIERQETQFSGKYDNPTLTTNFTYTFAPQIVGHLNLQYGEDHFSRINPEIGYPASGPVRTRSLRSTETGPEYEISGDLEFPLGPGKLKLIGLERFERDTILHVSVDSFNDGTPSRGDRFELFDSTGERIGRFEYNWKMLNSDWQISGEAAFNRLDRQSRLFVLQPSGAFDPIPFPSGNGGVTEDRYESILSYTKQLTPNLSLQATGGAELSKISQTGSAANSRRFFRPKGSLSLSWKPEADFNISIEARRRVSQLEFGDFLANVSLKDENQSGANNALVPYQSWNIELEVNKGLGAWGSAKLDLRQGWFEDFIDWLPLENGGEARGNIGNARRTHLEGILTLKMDPLGWRGAQFDIAGIKRWMHVTDPLTGEDRPFSNDLIDQLEVSFRHDIPGSNIAYGAGLFTNTPAPYWRRYEVGREWEGPLWAEIFVEHKDIFGMTVRLEADNLLGARNSFYRTVYDDDRPNAPILFVEDQNRRIGPIFEISLSGNF